MNSKDFTLEKYWIKNFNDNNIVGKSDDLQINIARTKNGKRVNEEIWKKTISYIIEVLEIDKESIVLELCCGNGLVIGEIAPYCFNALGIDYSKKLLNQLVKNYSHNNLVVEQNNVNIVELQALFFDSIIIYFSIQHFNERDAYLLIEKSIRSLKKDGTMLIGDIPDLDKKWSYINKPEYHLDYFKRTVECRPKIGYWFQKDFFRAMSSCFDNVEITILDQPNYQINSDHCFDILIKKNGKN